MSRCTTGGSSCPPHRGCLRPFAISDDENAEPGSTLSIDPLMGPPNTRFDTVGNPGSCRAGTSNSLPSLTPSWLVIPPFAIDRTQPFAPRLPEVSPAIALPPLTCLPIQSPLRQYTSIAPSIAEQSRALFAPGHPPHAENNASVRYDFREAGHWLTFEQSVYSHALLDRFAAGPRSWQETQALALMARYFWGRTAVFRTMTSSSPGTGSPDIRFEKDVLQALVSVVLRCITDFTRTHCKPLDIVFAVGRSGGVPVCYTSLSTEI